MNVWQRLAQQPHKTIGLSPMDGHTDAPFRYIIAKHCKPDLIFTEFVNVDSIYHSRDELLTPLLYNEFERPIIAQIFGIEPKLFYLAAQIVAELGFDGIDINMGCPSKNVSSRGAGAGLIKTPTLALEIIAACKQGVSDWAKNGLSLEQSVRAIRKLDNTKAKLKQLGTNYEINHNKEIPVSVKTRIGYSANEVDAWIPTLLKANPANISLHGRTFKQLYSGHADWDAIANAAELIRQHNNKLSPDKKITIWGNGDIKDYEQAQEYARKYQLDGVLIGRAVLGDPWVMLPKTERPQSLAEKIPVILAHSKIFAEMSPNCYYAMRKHLAWYFKGFNGASDLRAQLVRTNNHEEAEKIIFSCQNLTR